MLFFDIEADALLDNITKIHCIVTIDDKNNIKTYQPHQIKDGIKALFTALDNNETICGHNIIDYDLQAIAKIYPNYTVQYSKRMLCIDTLVLARLTNANLKESDIPLLKTNRLPPKLYGSYSLKAYGYRLGLLKGTFGETDNAFSTYNKEMLNYCVQDVKVTKKLYEYLNEKQTPQKAIELEHKAQWLMTKQKLNGVHFDIEKARNLEKTLELQKAKLDNTVLQIMPQIPDKPFIPKRDNKTLGYAKGIQVKRFKDFNPKSRQHIQWLISNHFDYTPNNINLFEGDRLKIDEETFNHIKGDPKAPKELQNVAQTLETSLNISKLLGQLSEGKNAWLKCYNPQTGCIHGTINPCGAVTGRATHSKPNLAQVPTNKECRQLFKPPDGWLQAGIDAAGLELRCLAHFLHPFDDGKYALEVVQGDIHTINQQAASLPTRNDAKRFIYAYLYGAGDTLIGSLIGGTASDGKRIKKEFLDKTPALKSLKNQIQTVLGVDYKNGSSKLTKRNYLLGLDKRRLHVRGVYAALNLLLQSAGALICKYWIVRLEERLLNLGLNHGDDFKYILYVHDEVQIACRTQEIAQTVIQEAQSAMKDAQQYYNIKCPLDTEGRIGLSWADTH